MSKSKLIREPDVLARVPFSKPTLHRRIKDGSFPPPVRIGSRAVAWVSDEIDEWERSIIAERDATRAPLSSVKA